MLKASYIAEVEYRGHKYIPDSNIEECIVIASRWLRTYSTTGLIMCGVPGNGKTTLMKAIMSLINFLKIKDEEGRYYNISLIDAKEIASICKENYENFKKFRGVPIIGIDDLGLEPMEVLAYGNILNPIVDLLSYRYDRQLLTVITTNLSPKEIREKYKDRIADRFNEMMTKIIFEGSSFRGRRI